MANYEDNDRQPRWNTSGYWTDRREGQDWEGDRSRSRDYDRGDMRRYGRRSMEQGERLRRMRGGREPWDSQLDTDQIGIHDEESLDFDRYRAREWGYDQDLPRDFQRRRQLRNRDIWQDVREQERRLSRGRLGQNPTWGNEGTNFRIEPGSRDWRWESRGDIDYQGTDSNLVDNYWGRREQGRDFRNRYPGAWWNNAGDRSDVTSARGYGRDIPTGPQPDWLDDRDYSIDPGFEYEFGTDFDFLNDVNMENYGNQWNEGYPPRGGSQGNRGGRQPENRGRSQANRGQGGREQSGGTWGRAEYGWEGPPYRQQARYREFWNTPGPYSGVGPQGYQRSDERIEEEICEIFTDHGQIDSSGLEVHVNNGDVTLTGDVDRREEKYLAEDIAASVMGVNDVNNRIRVRADDGVRVRGMGREDVVMPGRIIPGQRVVGLHGKLIGHVKEAREDGFVLNRNNGSDTFIPLRAIKRTNGQIILHVTASEIDQQNW